MNFFRVAPVRWSISLIALLQVAVVLGGMMFVNFMLKQNGYHSSMEYAMPYNEAAVWIGRSGYMLLFLPVIWLLMAEDTVKNPAAVELRKTLLITGVVMVLCGIVGYIMTGATCYDWQMMADSYADA